MALAGQFSNLLGNLLALMVFDKFISQQLLNLIKLEQVVIAGREHLLVDVAGGHRVILEAIGGQVDGAPELLALLLPLRVGFVLVFVFLLIVFIPGFSIVQVGKA